MGYNVNKRLCSCGALHGLREGCPRCTAAERERLHASDGQ
jgi:hypothetical protein